MLLFLIKTYKEIVKIVKVELRFHGNTFPGNVFSDVFGESLYQIWKVSKWLDVHNRKCITLWNEKKFLCETWNETFFFCAENTFL